jgi:hypothetical protein
MYLNGTYLVGRNASFWECKTNFSKKTFLDESRGLDSEDSLLGIGFNSFGMLQLVCFSDQIRLPSFHMIVTFLHVTTSVVWLFEFIKI